MNEEIHCITNERKTVKNEWGNDDSNNLVALCSLYRKLGQIFSEGVGDFFPGVENLRGSDLGNLNLFQS